MVLSCERKPEYPEKTPPVRYGDHQQNLHVSGIEQGNHVHLMAPIPDWWVSSGYSRFPHSLYNNGQEPKCSRLNNGT
ncbi:hypothetical protein DPMN_162224 [Dreissena polymorpha]|uniref:Uncharacterized protein n=1 Tax=Dreissena polymorpha TaxID=45954 RepID=A0A9D4EQ70_DREPO|nr:hypothetical protein DPMN_162224 [Dreissena polymorpha]